MLKAGVIGMGRWGQRLVNSVQRDGNPLGDQLKFVAGTTRTRQKIESFAQSQKLVMFDSVDAMLHGGNLDAVVIASPHSQHEAHVRAAVAAGLHVFVEKPLALEGATAQEMVSLCDEAGVLLAVGFNRRFRGAYRAMLELAQSGKLGKLLHVEGNFSGPFGFGYTADAWHAQPDETPAGGLTLMGVHVLDCMIGLMGPVASVTARSKRQALEVSLDDTTDASLEFHSGATGYLSTLTATNANWRLQVFGTKGWAQMIDQNQLIVSNEAGVQTQPFPDADAERAELEAFAAAAAGSKRPYPVPNGEVVNGIKTLTAITRSVKERGQPVSVD
ncbi:Gfo/Idh/MocA family protein [Burkholderia anthina]|uniref:Gfo/Idh/MocA family protein n=1 Tax=Burkholderia anthina TaxID=179879 RepID=UPI001AA01A63|nr:Gfo/Idh/MocA family oxidoreductase [Burkholderia anthina]QTD94939.1 Gfo/Idh/MocA family oxidoreductase [Burkholderia anthina]